MEKPWEKNGEEFNEEKAWTLIQNLRTEKTELQGKAEKLSQERDTAFGERDQVKATAEALGKDIEALKADLASRETELQKASALRDKENALLNAGLPRSLAQYIPDGDEETLAAAINQFSEIRGKQGTEVPPPNPAQDAENSDIDTDKESAARAFFGID